MTAHSTERKAEITFADFDRVDIRAGTIVEAEPFPEARNLDASGTGLGLPIARDIARSHGGDIMLEDSPLGGLRVIIRVPA